MVLHTPQNNNTANQPPWKASQRKIKIWNAPPAKSMGSRGLLFAWFMVRDPYNKESWWIHGLGNQKPMNNKTRFFLFSGTNKCCFKGVPGFPPVFSGEEKILPKCSRNPPPATDLPREKTCTSKKPSRSRSVNRTVQRPCGDHGCWFRGSRSRSAMWSSLHGLLWGPFGDRDRCLGIFLMDAFPAMAWGTKPKTKKSTTLRLRNEVSNL